MSAPRKGILRSLALPRRSEISDPAEDEMRELVAAARHHVDESVKLRLAFESILVEIEERMKRMDADEPFVEHRRGS